METNESMTKRELWRVRIDQYRSSGMTAKDWCISKDLSVSSLRYWITKFNKSEQFPEQEAESSDILFARLPSEEEIMEKEMFPPIRVSFCGIKIDIHPGCSKSMMSDLIGALRHNA